MRSDAIKKGLARAPHRSLLKADGLTDEEIERPLIAVISSTNDIIPGHNHLDKIADAVKAGVRMAGGTPLEATTIGVCDGIAGRDISEDFTGDDWKAAYEVKEEETPADQ